MNGIANLRNKLGSKSLNMQTSRKSLIAERFDQRVWAYNETANLQERIAGRMAEHLPAPPAVSGTGYSVLELGCGTGFLTGHLIKQYPGAEFWITDISRSMVQHCRSTFGNYDNVRFAQLDGETLQSGTFPETEQEFPQTFDLIVSSMVMQWFDDPGTALQRQVASLNKNGRVYFATLGTESFAEWREILESLDLPVGAISVNLLPGILAEEYITTNFGSGLKFLRHLKAIGAHTPSRDYQPISATSLKRALHKYDETYRGRVNWHIVYGCINSE